MPKSLPRASRAEVSRKTRPKTHRALQHIDKTQHLIRKIQAVFELPLLIYWTSSGGSICHNDVVAMSRLLVDWKSAGRVALFLKSDGGNPEAALRLVHLLRQRFSHITLLAPFECASAATMVALGANEIYMGPTSYLTAVDTSLKHDLSPVDHHNNLVSVSQDEVMRILRMWREQKLASNPFPEIYKYLHPLVLGALDRSSSLSMRICKELLSYHMDDTAKADRISYALNYEYPSHSYPITAREARRIGLTVKDLTAEQDALLRDLYHVLSEMTQVDITDYDTQNYHNEEICNVLEIEGRQVYFLVDKDWHYRSEERRWVPMHDRSGWFQTLRVNKQWKTEKFYIR
ncbi:MAG: hypothetical protein NZM04_08215 [Methylacidiphilales bacterium]|nr:hypothetical protein [Candidatus Methylacidiphilales bacterium]MDW8349025.1 hypothetical protein [Verrucomicrobiae bacterium]